MDLQKTLRVINDILADEKDFKIAETLKNIQQYINQNTSDAFSNANEAFNNFLEINKNTRVHIHSRSQELILISFNAQIFFGKGLSQKLMSIFSKKSFEVAPEIQDLIQKRNTFIQHITQLKNQLDILEIEEYRPDKYEVGIILPSAISTTENLQKYLKDFETFMKTAQEIALGKVEDVSITRTSTGCIELFSLQSLEVANIVFTTLLAVDSIFEKIAKYKNRIKEIEEDDFKPQTKKDLKGTIQKEIQSLKEDILEELPKKIVEEQCSKKIDAARKNELKNKVRIVLKAIFGWFELGIEIDVTPVRAITENEETQTPKATSTIQNNIMAFNNRHTAIYNLPDENRKLPFRLDGKK